MALNQSGVSVNVKVNVANNRIVATPAPIGVTWPTSSSVKTVKSQFNSVDTIAELTDVTGTPQDGYTLVYNASLNKFVVQQITVEDINITSLDGGTF